MGLFLRRSLILTASRIAIVAASTTLAGCSGSNLFSGHESASTSNLILPEQQDVVGGAAYWGAKYEANRDDIPAAVSFARNLRMMGGAQQAVTLLKEVVVKAPDDAKVLSEYGKALTAVGRSSDALPFFARAVQISSSDWTAFSAYGVALDQTGNHKAAQSNYLTALDLSSNNPAVQSNLAMSYVLSGQISQGEAILRKLVARPDATAQMRQNLVLVETIKGNKSEAEQLAKQDLTPADAFNNLSVLRQLSATTSKPAVPATSTAPAAPVSPPPNQAPMLVRPPNLSILPPPVRSMEPIADDVKTSSATPPAPVAPAATAPVATTAPASAPAKRKSPAVMAPIPDDATGQPKPVSAPKPLTPPKPAPDQAASATPTQLRQSLNADSLPESPFEMANVAQ